MLCVMSVSYFLCERVVFFVWACRTCCMSVPYILCDEHAHVLFDERVGLFLYERAVSFV